MSRLLAVRPKQAKSEVDGQKSLAGRVWVGFHVGVGASAGAQTENRDKGTKAAGKVAALAAQAPTSKRGDKFRRGWGRGKRAERAISE